MRFPSARTRPLCDPSAKNSYYEIYLFNNAIPFGIPRILRGASAAMRPLHNYVTFVRFIIVKFGRFFKVWVEFKGSGVLFKTLFLVLIYPKTK